MQMDENMQIHVEFNTWSECFLMSYLVQYVYDNVVYTVILPILWFVAAYSHGINAMHGSKCTEHLLYLLGWWYPWFFSVAGIPYCVLWAVFVMFFRMGWVVLMIFQVKHLSDRHSTYCDIVNLIREYCLCSVTPVVSLVPFQLVPRCLCNDPLPKIIRIAWMPDWFPLHPYD
jgi:hypothetical protein